MKKLDRHFGYYQCSLCGKKKGALYGETGAIGSNCSNVLRHTAGESHLRAWLADLPVERRSRRWPSCKRAFSSPCVHQYPHAGHSPSSHGGRRSIAHKWLGSARSQRTTQTKVRVQRKKQKIATNAAVDAAVAAGRAAAGALTPVTPAATQLPPPTA